LDGDNLRRWADRGSGGWYYVGEGRSIHGMDEDVHVGGGELVGIGFQLGLGINDKCGAYS